MTVHRNYNDGMCIWRICTVCNSMSGFFSLQKQPVHNGRTTTSLTRSFWRSRISASGLVLVGVVSVDRVPKEVSDILRFCGGTRIMVGLRGSDVELP